ncbi:putative secreted protein [Mesocricetibacter intestinalis]|uniref:Putative secreted protein n=1 Tax=Mesocricetibacter intestinalis TaxID=1521930 RepID=A0A4R6VA52_9PAST|nr:SIMPL domain-containing protein [Mesocricetibacter intestinalis]TDQ56506.1 putative secreted protein [Mesocricetibacter intestinalis]
MLKLKHFLFAALLLPMAAYASAEKDNLVSFEVQSERELPRDLFQVRMFLNEEGQNLKNLNKVISDKLVQATELIKKQQAVEIQSNNRQTHVRYDDKGRKTGWRGSAELVLQSKDSTALSQLIDELSGLMAIDNVNATVSSQSLARIEEEMTKEILGKFRHKAELISTSLQAKGYNIVRLDILAPSQRYPESEPRLYKMAAARNLERDTGPVQLEGGKAVIHMQLNGQIGLIKD